MKIVVTGGAGFIGSVLVRYLINYTTHTVINVDKLTYAGHSESLPVEHNKRYFFEKEDIIDRAVMQRIFEKLAAAQGNGAL